MCPGRHLADNSLYAIVSSVLAVYDITPPMDNTGKPVKLQPELTTGLLSYVVLFLWENADIKTFLYSYPLPSKCNIIPRNAAAEVLINASANAD